MSIAAQARPVARVVEHHLLVYRRTWRGTLFSTFFSPILFLAAIGIGLGTFIDDANPAGIEGVGYLAFLAPGLLVAQAMQTAAFESTYPVMAGIRWLKTYVAMIISPLDSRHVATGQLVWAVLRVTFGAAIFALVMALFGAIEPTRAVLLLPVAALTGVAFAAPIQAFAAAQKNDSAFASLFRFVITPMFSFCGTFFPVTQLPELLQVVAYLTPLWHAVALARAIALDMLDPLLAVINVTYLCVFGVVGLVASYRTFGQKLAE
jgi:lipooligosaccharide transport system permease protein